MTTKEKRQDTQTTGLFPWQARATFRRGKTRRQRQAQYRQQMNMLGIVLAVTVLASAVFIIANWREGGAIKTVSCAEFPQFCVPTGGGAPDSAAFEAPGSRELDAESSGVPGVVRGADVNNIPTIGDPNAPIHFVTVSDYACPHCQDFHGTDVPRFIEDYVLTGQATFGFVMVTGTGRTYSETASMAALCAGEQGAFWEMSEEFFRLARTSSIQSAFSLSSIRDTAETMGLDGQAIVQCVTSGKYLNFMSQFQTFALDNGVTGTPTVLVSYGDSNKWTIVQRDYGTLSQLTEIANNRQ